FAGEPTMALRKRGRSRFWSRLHFLIRFLGLTGLAAAGAGGALTFYQGLLDWPKLVDLEFVRPLFLWESGSDLSRLAIDLLYGGAAAAFSPLLTNPLVLLSWAAGRRSVPGFGSLVRVPLAAPLLAGLTLSSSRHSPRFDWTSNRQFTLPEDIR